MFATRAVRAYTAMRRRFWTRRGHYRRDGCWRLPGSAAHLWPFARAFVATLDLAGVAPEHAGGFDADARIAEHLAALEQYWDPAGEWPAYSSDVAGTRFGGDRYYDDNAWVGLALVQLERMRPGAGRLPRAAELFRFAAHGWDRRTDVPSPGGVFWVQQGRGVGTRNHDRNTVSNAPNAQLGVHLAQLGHPPAPDPTAADPLQMYDWVNLTLDAGFSVLGTGTAGGTHGGDGLFWDKIRGDDSVDRALWSYNQGSMIGLNVLLARAGGDAAAVHLQRAQAIARRALDHYAGRYFEQPAAFHAIFFRNLLLLHAATTDERLRHDILGAMRDYADHAWEERRRRDDCFALSAGPLRLLDQSAMVQILALLAWSPANYEMLA
ncbi:MAG TPA: glycoside hydrolase family 76 protein [Solirubrobacteraceae bacterium]|nr:glycoside hydrolase family 76 protein [Solirubrobacteraceae bacterium]